MAKCVKSTIGDAWRWFVGELTGIHGHHEASAIGREVFLRFFNMGPDQRVIRAGEALPLKSMARLENALGHLQKGMPVQYLTGVAGFLDFELEVAPGVLIPRQETQELVLWAVSTLENKYDVSEIAILDIGTGSGCLAIALARLLPKAVIYACDVSQEALTLAKKNTRKFKLGIHYFICDILKASGIGGIHGKFDCIISNPPYVRHSEKLYMKPNVVDFEPEVALFVDDKDPLVYYRAIAQFACQHLNPEGMLFFEINEAFGKEISSLIEQEGFQNVTLKQDIHGKDRFVSGVNGRP